MRFPFICWRLSLRTGLWGSLSLSVIGCQTDVSRGGAGEEYTRDISALYDEPAVNHGPRTIEFPVNVAVAQVGETTPSQAIVDKLMAAHDVVHRVVILSANLRPSDSNFGGRPSPATRELVPRLQGMARDQGADYLLICGTSVETRTRVNRLSGFDLTIIGAFISPSRNSESNARASAALIDVRSGTVVLTVGAQASKSVAAPAATTLGEADRIQVEAGEESMLKLADNFVADARRRSADDNAIEVKEAGSFPHPK